MRKLSFKIRLLVFIIALFTVFSACSAFDVAVFESAGSFDVQTEQSVSKDGEYAEYKDVAAYIHTYNRLPRNYITKKEAMNLGWISSEGNLWDVADRMCIGGDVFGNREGRLPDTADRVWYECDVNYHGGFRGGERIVYSNDGLIYYSPDHYETFIKLY